MSFFSRTHFEFMKIEPSRQIPARYRDEFNARLAGCLKNRIFTFCISTAVLFFATLVAGFYLTPEISLIHRIKLFTILAVGSTAILLFNRQSECGKCIIRSKTHAFVYILLLLTVVQIAAGAQPTDYSYSHYILLIFFSTVMLPWSLLETFGVIAAHFAAFFVYFAGRDLSQAVFPPHDFWR